MSKFTEKLAKVGHAVVTTDLADIGHGVVVGAKATGRGAKVVGRKTAAAPRKVVDALPVVGKDELDEAFDAVMALDETDSSPEALAIIENYSVVIQNAVAEATGSTRKLLKLQARLGEQQEKHMSRYTPEQQLAITLLTNSVDDDNGVQALLDLVASVES